MTEWVENRPTRGARALDWAELWRYRELVVFLSARDLKVRYKQAAFGVLWAVAQPLATLGVLALVFRRLAGVPSDGVPYLLFALTGVALWTTFAGAVESATTSLVSNASLVTKVYFPRVAAPLAAVLPRLVDLGVALLLLGGLLLAYGRPLPLQVLVLPLVVLWLTVLAFGVGVALATLQVQYRDAHHATKLLLQVWLLVSPVGYGTTLVPESWRWAYALNPVAGLLDTARWAVLGTARPGPSVLLSLLVTGALLALGLRLFVRSERRFADVI